MLTVTLLFAAMLAINRLFVAEREQGGFDAFLLAPVDRTAMLVAKATALFIFLVVLEVIAVPAFGLLLLGPSLGHALPGLVVGAGAGGRRLRGDRNARLGDRRAHPRPRPDRADHRAAVAAAGADRDGSRGRAAAGAAPLAARRPASGWQCWLSMIWCSRSSPTRCSTSCWRSELFDDLRPRGLRGLSVATTATITAALALVFFYAPLDANQGFVQKIFYIHVPLAIVVAVRLRLRRGAWRDRHLRTGDRKWDMRSYVAIHMALIFGVGGLITGSIWAKASWGHWWVWSEPTLVSFLIVMLLFATYQPLRFSIEDPERQARYASVFAIVAGAFVPLNFIAVRLAAAVRAPARAHARRAAICRGRCGSRSTSRCRDRAAVRDAVEVRDGGQEHAHRVAPAAAGAAR